MDDKQRYQQGMTVRRKVLGDTHVDKTLQKLTPLNEEFGTSLPATPGEKPGPDRGSITIPAV